MGVQVRLTGTTSARRVPLPGTFRMNRWTSKFSFLGRGAWAIGIAAATGALVAYLLVPVLPSPNDEPKQAVEVRMLGQALPLDDRAMQVAANRVRRFVASNIHLQLPNGKIKEMPLGRLGAQIDKLHLTSLVREARDPHSLLRRAFTQAPRRGPLELPVPVVLDPIEALKELVRLKDELDRVPTDARMDLEKRELVPEVPGQLLDVDQTFLAIEQAVMRGDPKAKAAVLELRPRRVASELTNVRFSHVLGYFETRYDRSDKARDRTYNLRLAASKLDGHVLLPGETFDFNDVVGPRDETNGYRIATVIAEGELVDGIGGGTCQISGTLHGAVFFSGLEILERVPHTRPSSYIKMGLDATVVYPTINFRFKNNFEFPVVLHQFVKDGIVRAEVLGPERKHAVTLIRRITEALPYEQLEREDDRLPRGVRVLSQRGVAGFTVTRYRIVREQQFALRERWQDRYPPTPQIVRVGTGDMPKDSVEVNDDPHPEYLADELLVMTLTSANDDAAEGSATEGNSAVAEEARDATSRDASKDAADLGERPPLDALVAPSKSRGAQQVARTAPRGAGMFESRQAGWTGVAGWTKEQKMPQWEPPERSAKVAPGKAPTSVKSGSSFDQKAAAGKREAKSSERPGRSN